MEGRQLTCVVVTRNGNGAIWIFATKAEARIHPIPQSDDIYAETADQLVSQYGKGHIEVLLKHTEGRDRARLVDAMETWKASKKADINLSNEARDLIWSKVLSLGNPPPKDPAEIVRIIVEDRVSLEGKTLRSLPRDDARSFHVVPQHSKEDSMSDKAARAPKIPDTHVISIATEGGKNPKREGTASFDRFAMYKDGMTVKEAKEAGVKAADISYDAHPDRGYITLTPGEAEAEAA